ncbi:MAG: response regulator FixJ [Caulobacteraceae bacterium]
MASPLLVHVIDDDEAVRDSLCFLLETAGLQARSYDSGTQFLDGLTGEETGCIITDVRMPGLTGLELAVRLTERGCLMPVIVITGHADVPLAVEAMKAGVRDFIEKPFDDSVILNAIEAALADAHSDGDGAAKLEIRRRIDSLSARERQVLDGLVGGKANKVMARDLGISPRTVEVYRANVMAKVQAASLSELVRMTIVAGRAG